jgi:phytoene synthase
VSLEAAYAHCEAAAREGARDRWLGALFAPASARRHLHALIAFELEMARLREVVREPRAGEIRLVWWREALTGERRSEGLGNPVAAAMIDTLEAVRPPPHLIENAIAGRQADLYDDPFPTTGDLEAYLGETRSGLLQIAALALGGDNRAGEASGLAGVALGLIELLRAASRPRPFPLPPLDMCGRHGAAPDDFRRHGHGPAIGATFGEVIALARRRAAEAKPAPALRPAYAGLATAPLWLDAAARIAGRLPEIAPEIAAWRRQWALWRWMRRG